MTPDLDSLATALCVQTDDLLKESPHLAPWRPRIGIAPRLSDAELVSRGLTQRPHRSAVMRSLTAYDH